MKIHGKNRIGYELSSMSDKSYKSYDPVTLKELPELYSVATNEEINLAMNKAMDSFKIYKNTNGKTKARFLNCIAEEIEILRDKIIEQACKETGLPEGRIKSELERTQNQLKMFASLVSEGSWVEASIDTSMPDRQPVPKPDIRKMLRPIGPVVVFSASNFPLAFSTAGGDTSSALAGGHPVIVKAHPSHPGTNLLVAEAINLAAIKTGMPDGVFSTLYSDNNELGLSLVKHPFTKAVGFTGSLKGGMALIKAASERNEPIPVFTEMGSVNPVILLTGKLSKDGESVAKVLATSVSAGAGQFCTNPGLMATINGSWFESFISSLAREIEVVYPQTMLNKNIWETYIVKRNKTYI